MTEKNNNIASPAVSVVMPAYNCERYIEEAVRSVMAQTVSDWELIVIDDGSTDSTCDVVRRLMTEEPRITLHQNPENMGVAKTRNRGLAMSRGKYVALLDSDDVWHPEKLEKQICQMECTHADLAYCSYAMIDDDGKPCKQPYIVPDKISFESLLKENVIGCSTVVLSSAVAGKYRFASDFYHEDYCLWLNILRDVYKTVGCADVLVNWRYIAGSRSFDKKNSTIKRWKIYREYLNLSAPKSMWLFLAYAVHGVKKYLK